MDLTTLDFQQGRIKLFLLRSKVRSGLYGAVVDESVCSPVNSPVGSWFYTVVLPKYGGLPEVKELENINRETHAACGQLLNLYKSGKIDEARIGLKDFDAHSDNYLKKLEALSARLV